MGAIICGRTIKPKIFKDGDINMYILFFFENQILILKLKTQWSKSVTTGEILDDKLID